MHKNLPYADPVGLSSGNVQGYQSDPMPTTRNISFNVKVNFKLILIMKKIYNTIFCCLIIYLLCMSDKY